MDSFGKYKNSIRNLARANHRRRCAEERRQQVKEWREQMAGKLVSPTGERLQKDPCEMVIVQGNDALEAITCNQVALKNLISIIGTDFMKKLEEVEKKLDEFLEDKQEPAAPPEK